MSGLDVDGVGYEGDERAKAEGEDPFPLFEDVWGDFFGVDEEEVEELDESHSWFELWRDAIYW